jgi:hypothetical protein
MDDSMEGKNYSQTDYLAEIGFQAQPGDIYYMNPPKELSSYPMYISNPTKQEKKPVGSFIAYTMQGTDISEKLLRRYSDFFALYEKLLQRWPGIYIPRVPPKKITGNLDPNMIKSRMRLLNRFCLNLSNIGYLYNAEETNIFRNNIPEVANAINKLPELSYAQILQNMKEAFPEYNQNYDIIVGKSKFDSFLGFLNTCVKKINEFKESVDAASSKREIDKKQYLEFVKNFADYESGNIRCYSDNNDSALIFNNPSLKDLSEKMLKLKQEMINPFVAFRDWLEEEILDVEAMQIAIKKIFGLLETEDKLKAKSDGLNKDLEGGQVNFFKSIFKKKEELVGEMQREKEVTDQKILDVQEIIKIVGDNLENEIEKFKNDKTQNYYKYLKMFAIMQRESNRVVRELWTLVKNALNEINPKGEYNEYNQPEVQNEDIHLDNQQQGENEIKDEQPPQEGEQVDNPEE